MACRIGLRLQWTIMSALDSVLVKGIFWLLFSKYSSMPTSERAKYIPPNTPNLIRIKDDYVNCHCSFPIATERSRRGTI